jgi:ATP-dependent Lon protease
MTSETEHGPAVTEERPYTVPPDIPALPLRDTVLFPNSFMPLAVARESSVKLIDDAIAGGKVTRCSSCPTAASG